MKKHRLKSMIAAGLVTAALFGAVQGCGSIKNHDKLEKLVLSEAKNKKVVMFGEQHTYIYNDNLFVAKTLPRLKEQGFTYFAAELPRHITEKDDAANAIKDYALGRISRKDIGLLTKVTLKMFASGWLDLMQSVREAGMSVVFYDAKESETTNQREKTAFQNLKELIFDKNPDAKVVVYAGAMHLSEEAIFPIPYGMTRRGDKSAETEFESVACHINRYTNGNMLTVSLVGKDSNVKHCDIVISLWLGKAWYKSSRCLE